jgi:hypothetical protein
MPATAVSTGRGSHLADFMSQTQAGPPVLQQRFARALAGRDEVSRFNREGI